VTSNRLLVVDDEPAIGALVADVAERLGYEVCVTDSASGFLEHSRRWRPTHIAMDLMMPDATGVDLMSHLAAEKSTARILLMSGVDVRVLEAARRIGVERGLKVEGALTKPIRGAELRAALQLIRSTDEWLGPAVVMGALERDEFVLWFQPKIELQTYRVVGLEALARWEHPTRGLISPGDFIPFVEDSALIDELTHSLSAKLCRHLSAWSAEGVRLDVALNISARNLHDGHLANTLEAECRRVGVPPEQITLELTETAAMQDAVQLTDVVTRLRLKGFRLSIDDFGTGYSSLVQLHRLPFCELKIDRAFIANCTTSAESRSIVDVVIDLGHRLGMTVVAEGVEASDALELLADRQCDQAQGYFIARPMPANEVIAWVTAWADPATRHVQRPLSQLEIELGIASDQGSEHPKRHEWAL
jgi:EAL domain-containing protein (putative c-di-GMP-specific phosphodiesterase class I)/ActR/RegA family two-component response regulator